ncbi:adenosylmethionine--8-amino-7-oxononanoate transaminase [Methanothermococcus sp. SCGC AD-155-C09]|nr:adenosylmethionine--8-amino-7-oxononanoate transaminase [Methanothermococcus sp. SCGC AD-155-C09]
MTKDYSPKELIEWDKKYIWHPYTQMKEYNPPFKNLIIERGEGNYLIDINGKKYLDAVSSIWCNLFGHSEKRIIEEIKRQTDKICHSTLLGSGNVPSILLAKKLVEIAPPHLNKVFYSEDGSEAVEIALKMAFEYYQLKDPESNKKRTKFLSVKEGYHGDTIGAMSVGGSETFHGIFKPLLFKGYYGNAPYCYRCKYGHDFKNTDERMERGCSMDCLEDMLNLIEKHRDELFCIILEGGVMGSAGMIPYPNNYIEEVARKSKEEGILLILDEVATFARLGKYLFSDNEKLKKISKPDIITIGKGITGGYLPLALTMVREEIYNQFLGDFEEYRQFFHGHTYTGNQLLCTSAIATLDILEGDEVFKKMGKKIELLHRSLDRLKELEHVGDIRKRGFMIGIELVKNKNNKESYPPRDKVAYRVAENLLKRGIYMRPIFNTIIIVPPLTITEDEIEFLCFNLYEAIKENLGIK